MNSRISLHKLKHTFVLVQSRRIELKLINWINWFNSSLVPVDSSIHSSWLHATICRFKTRCVRLYLINKSRLTKFKPHQTAGQLKAINHQSISESNTQVSNVVYTQWIQSLSSVLKNMCECWSCIDRDELELIININEHSGGAESCSRCKSFIKKWDFTHSSKQIIHIERHGMMPLT